MGWSQVQLCSVQRHLEGVLLVSLHVRQLLQLKGQVRLRVTWKKQLPRALCQRRLEVKPEMNLTKANRNSL